jgi:uncharacterized protein YbaR (Trm112 family)
MYLVLTDLLTCPKCGPDQGLIVLADRVAERRVLAGRLGCPICESQYPIVEGAADLRVTAGAEIRAPTSTTDWFKIAALLGLTSGPGYALIVGAESATARRIAQAVPGLEVVSIGVPDHSGDVAGVSQLLIDTPIPLRSGGVRAALIGTGVPENIARDAIRLVPVGARIVFAAVHEWVDDVIARGVLRVPARDAEYTVTIRTL